MQLVLFIAILLIFFADGYILHAKRFNVPRLSCIEVPEIDIEAQLLSYENTFPHITSNQWGELVKLGERVLEWNSKVNLISRKDSLNLVPNHIIPCLAMSLVRRFNKNEAVIDVGTGGGLPGLPISIVNPSCQVTLLDSNSKKMMVVEDMAKTLKLDNVRVVCARAEALQGQRFDFVLGRAVSAIPNFLGFSSHLMSPMSTTPIAPLPAAHLSGESVLGNGLLYLKGGEFDDELAGAGIVQHTKYAVRDLVPGLDSDKYVLHVPAAEVVAFHERHALATAAKIRKRKKGYKSMPAKHD